MCKSVGGSQHLASKAGVFENQLLVGVHSTKDGNGFSNYTRLPLNLRA